mgnify:CR=1 FL=1
MSPYVTNAGSYLVSVIFGIFILAVMLRFLFQLVRADFYNPVSQAIVKLTTPALKPLRRVIPGLRGMDVPALVLALVLQALELWLILAMSGNATPSPAGILVLGIAELGKLTCWIFIIAVIAQVIISWVAPGAYNPMTQLLYSLTRPVLQPAQRLLPPVGGIDFSPLLTLVALNLALMLVVAPLRDLGAGLLA